MDRGESSSTNNRLRLEVQKKDSTPKNSKKPSPVGKKINRMPSYAQQKNIPEPNYEEIIANSETIKSLQQQIGDLVHLKDLEPKFTQTTKDLEGFRTLLATFQKDLVTDR